MRSVNRSALVPYSAQQMYALVADVAAYPQFLPWCTGAEVHEQTATELTASIGLGIGALHTDFKTRNELRAPNSMSMDLLDGPFSSLRGRWDFSTIGTSGCEVHLQVEFEFSNAAQDMLFGAGFEKICNELIDAFVRRANELYGDG
jgi:ribosome-associated toxin RatA of RatAB toxin-antitoxin module